MDLDGSVAMVTGAARRIGRAIALALAEAGAHVALHYRRSASDAEATAEAIRAAGRRAELFQADLADPTAIAAMFAAVRETFGRLDILVNNAASYARTPIETLTASQWDSQMAVNARAPALCIRHAIELMGEGGAIINIADIAAEKPFAGYPAYCASKAALVALTKAAAKALAGRNIRVNAVAPGVAVWQDDLSDKQKREVLSQVPMQRAGSASDVGAAVVFLAQHDYITAQTLRVDGGWHMG
ncbi:MAG: SDR family NAD(P)-dependent oxidoreductase [Planctomycetota bacterium]|jgi:NAD(P)-dependent dehydrogenase (short-subunit alcohol dehydrogenase family)